MSDHKDDSEQFNQMWSKMQDIVRLYGFEFSLDETQDLDFCGVSQNCIYVYKNIDDEPKDKLMFIVQNNCEYHQPNNLYNFKYLFYMICGKENDIVCSAFVDPIDDEYEHYTEEHSFVDCDEAFDTHIETAMHIVLHAFASGIKSEY